MKMRAYLILVLFVMIISELKSQVLYNSFSDNLVNRSNQVLIPAPKLSIENIIYLKIEELKGLEKSFKYYKELNLGKYLVEYGSSHVNIIILKNKLSNNLIERASSNSTKRSVPSGEILEIIECEISKEQEHDNQRKSYINAVIDHELCHQIGKLGSTYHDGHNGNTPTKCVLNSNLNTNLHNEISDERMAFYICPRDSMKLRNADFEDSPHTVTNTNSSGNSYLQNTKNEFSIKLSKNIFKKFEPIIILAEFINKNNVPDSIYEYVLVHRKQEFCKKYYGII